MHKHLSTRGAAVALIFIITCLGVLKVRADTPLPWISSNLSVLKQADTINIPPTLGNYGNIDCSMEDTSNCTVPTDYGVATGTGTVRFNSTFTPVITYIDGRQHFLPVPNSGTAISYFSGLPYGLDLAFNYNFSSSVVKSGNNLQILRAPDGKLTDLSKHLLAADVASMSFSENGQWMVVSDPNVAMLRVNLQTFEVLPFGTGFNYTIGLDPAVKTAISNDGRYVAVASKSFTTFRVYDLSTCPAAPASINGPVSCQSRDLNAFAQQTIPSYSFTASVRFADDDTLAFYAVYKSGTTNKTARFIISTGNIVNHTDYLALGDSYISGEGAFDYMGGTDTVSNRCHVSFLAYPFLLGHDLNYNSFHSVACSGAVTDDIINTGSSYKGQADSKQITRQQRDAAGQTPLYLNAFSPGYIDQLEFVKTYQPKVVTTSIGGNDMGFSDILKKCVDPRNIETCYSTYEDRLELIRQIDNQVYPRLVQTYQKLKFAGPPDMRIYVIGYPQIAKAGGDCALNVHLNRDELVFAQQLISYLDLIVQQAATKTGIDYVDTQNALNGHRLCEAGPGSVAMNGLTAGNDTPTQLGGPIGNESYHPNATGYDLLENAILAETHNLTDTMPAANLSAALPAESSLEFLDVTHSGRTTNTGELDPAIAPDFAYVNTPTAITISGALHDLAAATQLNTELHSTPIGLGTFTTDGSGNLSAFLTIPATAPAGYHSLHFYGTDLIGQQVDIYKTIYVAASPGDIDGDGVPDNIQRCVGIAPSEQDFDQDGVDDACDADITHPPAATDQNTETDSQINLTAAPQVESNIVQSSIVAAVTDRSDQTNNSDGPVAGSSPAVLGLATQKPRSAVASDTSNDSSEAAGWNYLILAVPILIIVSAPLFKRWMF